MAAALASRPWEEAGLCRFLLWRWGIGQCLALPSSPFTCGVGIHPAWTLEKLHGRTDVALAEAIGAALVLLMPAGNDSPSIKPGRMLWDPILARVSGPPNPNESLNPFRATRSALLTSVASAPEFCFLNFSEGLFTGHRRVGWQRRASALSFRRRCMDG